MKKINILLLLFMLSLTACGSEPAPATPSVEQIQTAIAQTEAAMPTETPTSVPPTETPIPITLEPTPTLEPTLTSTPTQPFEASINADRLNLRSGPSTFFEVLGSYEEDQIMIVMMRTPNNQWVQVQTPDNLVGWMAVEFLSYEESVEGLPLIDYPTEQIISGRVEDTDGNAIEGIEVAAYYREDDSELRTDMISDEQGNFEIYLPGNMEGSLDIQIIGVLCTSQVVDEDCELYGHYQVFGREFVNIPQTELLIFLYQPSGLILEGTVEGFYDGLLVVAEREDGAESYGSVDENGNFSIPIGTGLWEIYSAELIPRNEGDRITLEVGIDTLEPITLTAP